jgi:hypothetical protein
VPRISGVIINAESLFLTLRRTICIVQLGYLVVQKSRTVPFRHSRLESGLLANHLALQSSAARRYTSN